MKGTFTATGRVFTDVDDGGISFVRGGKDKSGLLALDFGTGGVDLEVSTDKGATWVVIKSYTADAAEKVSLPDFNAIYTLNCTAYTADIGYSLTSK